MSRCPFFFSQFACIGLYLNIISPLSSPPNSHGSTITISPGLTHSFLFSLPGILQFLVCPSRHLTSHLDAPSLASRIPSTSFPLGSLTLNVSSSLFCCLIFIGEGCLLYKLFLHLLLFKIVFFYLLVKNF